MPGSGAEGVLRGLELLEVLAGLEQPASLARIADRAGFNEAAAYRTLRRLEEHGYVDHVARAGYRLGSRSVALAALVGPDPPLLKAAHRVLTRLVATTGYSAALHLRSGSHRVLVVGLSAPSDSLREEVALGERAPLTSGSAGRVILAHLPSTEVDKILAHLPGETHPTAADLARIRRDGHLTGQRRGRSSLRGISAPLVDPESGMPLGSVTMAAAGTQATTASLRQALPVLLRACSELQAQMAALLGPGASRGRRGLDITVSWRSTDT